MRSTNSFIKTAKPFKLILTVLVCAALVGGCSGDISPQESPSPTPQDTSGDTTPQAGGSLALPMPEGAVLGNPLTDSPREMSSIYGLIFESLLDVDDTGAPAPGIAETWPPNPDGADGKSWTFKLRTGVKWQGSGRQVDANDVLFTLNQIKQLGPNTPYDYVTQYIDIAKCKANDDGTLSIALKQSFYGALHALTFPVLPADGGYDNGGAPDTPVGSGPYKVTAYEKGKSIKLTANSDWWKNAPYIPDITVSAFPDNATEVSSLLLSQMDAVQTEDLTVTQYRDSGAANVYEYPTRYFEYMALNFTSPDLKDKNMRQAIAFAIDRQQIVSYTYVNHATVTDTPVPPDSWLYDGKLLHYNNDMDEAKRLIEQAGWKFNDTTGFFDTSPDGVKRDLEFTLLTNRDENNTLRSDAATLIADQLKKAGIKVDVMALPWDDYTTKVKQKSFDLALCGCYLSPVPDYSSLLSSTGTLNVGGYKSDDMDKLLGNVLASPGSKQLKVNVEALQAKVIDDLPFISLYFRSHSLLTSMQIQGVTRAGIREDSAFARINQWYIAK